MSRPVFFDLLRIQMPVGALTSITHRVSGVLLALGIPLGLYALQCSLASEPSYAQLASLATRPLFKAAVILWVWALSHHLLAGVRHLLMDVGVGSYLPQARRSAWAVNIGGFAMALLTAGAVW